MLDLILVLAAFAAGVLFSAYRLRGVVTMKDAIKMVIQGGGGPGPRQ